MNDVDLLGDALQTTAPKTQGVKYAGSKLKLLPQILSLAGKVPAKSVFDGFAGTTRVSQAFSKLGYDVISNDVAIWSRAFARCYLLTDTKKAKYYGELVEHLNAVTPLDGWFTANYGGEVNDGSAIQSDGLKKPWQIKNTRKLDGIRMEIDSLCLEPVDKALALTSLILAMDKVDSTLGHYVSYLKEWSPRSYKDVYLEVPDFCPGKGGHIVENKDIFDVIGGVKADLSYFDPPYGSNNEKMPPSRVRYASYYHPWKSICLNDEPELFGKASRRADSSDRTAGSVFEEFKKNLEGQFIAVKAIEKLLNDCKSKWIILSYSSGGRATAAELDEVMRAKGKVLEVIELDHKKNVMAEMKWTNEWLREAQLPNREFLFLLENQ